jgi:hypothetical protein
LLQAVEAAVVEMQVMLVVAVLVDCFIIQHNLLQPIHLLQYLLALQALVGLQLLLGQAVVLHNLVLLLHQLVEAVVEHFNIQVH